MKDRPLYKVGDTLLWGYHSPLVVVEVKEFLGISPFAVSKDVAPFLYRVLQHGHRVSFQTYEHHLRFVGKGMASILAQ